MAEDKVTTEELKRCPFCGGYASLISEYDVESDQGFYYVYCTKCGVEQGYYSKTQEEAIEKWNRRVKDA